jgi:pimeloyl-ACP methyl ester carboxylesterase
MYTIENVTIQGIPVLTIRPGEAHRRPAVFYIPGYSAPKESGLSLGYQLAQHGYFFVSFDPLLHGERFDPRLWEAAKPELGGIYPPETGLDIGVQFYHVIYQCLADFRTLLAHFALDPHVDVSRCGVTGHSMGAYASFLIFANEPAVKAAVPMMGIPSFSRRWEDILDECSFSNAEWAAALARVADARDAHTAFVRQIDPEPKLAGAAPRALLIMNGDFDHDQPKSYTIACYRTLQQAYRDAPDNLKLNIYPLGHVVDAAMERDAVTWFDRHLK